ncbi:TPA: IS21 family transposase [Legionella pneumophila]|uniref:IS21 family transposase n=1 Tax=Legionella anisa TaxID=28082 RepID=UPI00038205FD|nr:IS21 family transposase [Legionella anisa]HCD9287893.1 IS21 family transposase [Legionella pneumophila]MBN5937700.1 IS21 family transposase [Legionella anisa]MCW8426811.1 IS21 family transposase [Legionella anisa]MCW8426839.1 IS21 family transposase [Legionella anisa]MCW8449493.1 IS21 family transposase [Legionella anisa]
MPTEKLSMRKIREVLRLRYESGLNNRDIAMSVAISASTVSTYLSRAKMFNVTWPLPASMSDDELYACLFPQESNPKKLNRPTPDLSWVHRELKRKGVTLLLLWYEYRSQYPEGYGYSRFCEMYRDFSCKLNPSMRITHHAGEKLFVDYSGLTVPWIDKETGVVYKAEIFVAVLGASNYTFVEAAESQSLRHWISAHIRAFEFFGGVPTCIVPDNLKSGVTQSHLYDPDTNITYQEMANYYNVAVTPARVRSPKDKAKVEVGVQGIQRWILAPLRDCTFFSISEINVAITPLLKAYNERPLQQLVGSRYSQFVEIDRPALKSLPIHRYQFAYWKRAKAGIDYHVTIEKHHYSIPWRYLGELIDVRISDRTIECFLNNKRIALHQRSFKPGHTTQNEHMPKAHQDYVQWTPERLKRWAQSIGPYTAQLINEVIGLHKIPQQGYRACLGILRLSKKYGKERLENAAIRGLHIGAIRYKNIESILKNGLDKQPLSKPASTRAAADITNHHENVRGANYYH